MTEDDKITKAVELDETDLDAAAGGASVEMSSSFDGKRVDYLKMEGDGFKSVKGVKAEWGRESFATEEIKRIK